MMNLDKKNKLVEHWVRNKIITNDRVIKAFKEVPRENFVLKKYIENAYEDYPLPIPAGQTISQPTTVMIMTQELELEAGNKVLEIGTGSGYQAAIIAKIVGTKIKVVSTEIIPELARFAKENLEKSRIKNVAVVKVKDDSIGYKREAKYDRIIITAAIPEVPAEIYDQLNDDGILVAPVGDEYSQELLKIRKLFYNKYDVKRLGTFQFVPCKGKFGF